MLNKLTHLRMPDVDSSKAGPKAGSDFSRLIENVMAPLENKVETDKPTFHEQEEFLQHNTLSETAVQLLLNTSKSSPSKQSDNNDIALPEAPTPFVQYQSIQRHAEQDPVHSKEIVAYNLSREIPGKPRFSEVLHSNAPKTRLATTVGNTDSPEHTKGLITQFESIEDTENANPRLGLLSHKSEVFVQPPAENTVIQASDVAKDQSSNLLTTYTRNVNPKEVNSPVSASYPNEASSVEDEKHTNVSLTPESSVTNSVNPTLDQSLSGELSEKQRSSTAHVKQQSSRTEAKKLVELGLIATNTLSYIDTRSKLDTTPSSSASNSSSTNQVTSRLGSTSSYGSNHAKFDMRLQLLAGLTPASSVNKQNIATTVGLARASMLANLPVPIPKNRINIFKTDDALEVRIRDYSLSDQQIHSLIEHFSFLPMTQDYAQLKCVINGSTYTIRGA